MSLLCTGFGNKAVKPDFLSRVRCSGMSDAAGNGLFLVAAVRGYLRFTLAGYLGMIKDHRDPFDAQALAI